MQQTEAASASSSLLYVYRDDLELLPLACDKSPDLVASVVHVSTEGKVPLRTVTTATPVRMKSTTSIPEQEQRQHLQLHLLTEHQYVGVPVDQQHQLQISPIASSPPSTKASTAISIHSSCDSPALDSARLIEPFTPVYPLNDSEGEERSPASLVQVRHITPPPPTNPASPNSLNTPSPTSPKEPEFEGTGATSSGYKSRMFFGDLQKSSAAAHRRRSMATTSALTDYEADLTSKDRMRQKDAIKRVLAGKVREDWEWAWPRDDNEPTTPIINRSQENLVSEDWKERDEWISNASASEDESGATLGTPTVVNASNGKNPFRFDNPDGVGDSVRKSAEDRKARRRRRLYEEMRVNDGLSCFTHRRNAWTCARHVRRIPRTTTLKRTLSRPTSKPSPAATVPAIPSTDDDVAEMMTEIRIASPILPPDTPMRKGINERAYTTIYDKVILQSQTPFCPINLSVVIKSCVEGWKRDGEWPPKPGEMETIIAGVRRSGLEVDLDNGKAGRRDTETKDENGSGNKGRSVLRRSLQKVMGAVRERAGSRGKDDEVV